MERNKKHNSSIENTLSQKHNYFAGELKDAVHASKVMCFLLSFLQFSFQQVPAVSRKTLTLTISMVAY